MATVSVPPKASLLGIPGEIREKILKHSFKGSLVKIDLPGRIAITTAFQHDIIAACKQLHAEGQNLLIAATTLFVVYAPTWIKWVPVSVAERYLSKIQEVHIDVREAWSKGFDIRPLPSLKVLHVGDFNSYHGSFPRRRLTIEKSKWSRIRAGEIDEEAEASIAEWFRKARSEYRESEEDSDSDSDSDSDYGHGNNTSWLLDILDNDVGTPAKIIIEIEERIFYKISDAVEADEKSRAVFVVSVHNSHASELYKSQALTQIADSTLRSQNA